MRRIRQAGVRALRGLAMAFALFALAGPGEGLAQPSAAEFFKPAQVARPVLSPSGRYVAFALTQGEARAALAVLDLEAGGPPKLVGSFRDSDVNRIWWVNDERLVFDALDRKPRRDAPVWPGLWAVNRDGSDYRLLVRPDYVVNTGNTRLNNDRTLDWNWQMYATLDDSSADVVVAQYDFNARGEVYQRPLSRLDTRTGIRTPLTDGAPVNMVDWVLDGKGVPVLAAGGKDGRYVLYRRGAAQEPWVQLTEGDLFVGGEVGLLWAGSQREQYLTLDSGGFAALVRLQAGAPLNEAKPVLKLEGYDFYGRVVADSQSRRVLGVQFESDAAGAAWFDEGMKAIQTAVDQALPRTVNSLSCSRCESSARILIAAESDRQPVEYYVYQRANKRISPLFASRPWLRGKLMGERDVQRFAARDGLKIPTLVTRPLGKTGPQPAVVLVHGGPNVRGTHWAWEPQAQFLASRGYVVIEPEFRGSQGYGFAHFKAGWKQWGLSMQDDVVDAVDWAVKQGWVDPKRVCIAGGSYGGYAALMGLVRHHDRYQCAVSWAGVTDIDLMYSIHWSDSSDEWKRYGLPVLVGDQVKDAEQFKATSPVAQADKVRRPVLLAYGTDDVRVPLKHGEAFRDAVWRHNSQVEWVTYADEGHGWLMQETRVDFWSRVEKFLARHLGTEAGR